MCFRTAAWLRNSQMFCQTLIVITHSMELAQLADRVVRLQDGRVV